MAERQTVCKANYFNQMFTKFFCKVILIVFFCFPLFLSLSTIVYNWPWVATTAISSKAWRYSVLMSWPTSVEWSHWGNQQSIWSTVKSRRHRVSKLSSTVKRSFVWLSIQESCTVLFLRSRASSSSRVLFASITSISWIIWTKTRRPINCWTLRQSPLILKQQLLGKQDTWIVLSKIG